MKHRITMRVHATQSFSGWLTFVSLHFVTSTCFGEATNIAVGPLATSSLPDAGPSLFRVIGALAMVLAIFFGGIWLVRNWQRLSSRRGSTPKLNLVETRSLGAQRPFTSLVTSATGSWWPRRPQG